MRPLSYILESLVVLAALGLAGCTYAAPVDRSGVEWAVLLPDRSVAIAFKELVYRPATGLAAWPDGGIPQYLRDREVIALNREALARLTCKAELRIVPGASHLFEEPGALEEVARLAAFWFRQHLGSPEWAPEAAEHLDAPVRGE